jgi:hypothetical protein
MAENALIPRPKHFIVFIALLKKSKNLLLGLLASDRCKNEP